jgi:four helix bundle protein
MKEEVFAFTSQGFALKDAKFCEQIRESSRLAPRNIAEGFGRYNPREFARFVRIAVASLHETKNHLHDGHAGHYLEEPQYSELIRITLRAIKPSDRLLAYLARATAPTPNPEDREDPENS